ncbi:MAG: hypothetical protein L0Z55_08440 [Planctomycetes bacterium]|nr:hypothetical protein [Planctomycetota bacterium]
MRAVWRIYASTCGLIVGPALLALALAHFMGYLPKERLLAALETYRGGATAHAAAPAPTPLQAPASHGAGAAPPEDLRTWERRLQAMGAGIASNVSDLSKEFEVLQSEDKRLSKMRDALARLLSAFFREEVTAAAVLARAPELSERIEKSRADEERTPKLLATLQTIEPRALAAIFAGKEGAPGLEEEQAAAVLAEFTPRKAGQVLAEVGKLDPSLAARMVARISGKDPAFTESK